ncbi:MAG: alkaline phosphatase family protein [Pseudomonadota bacterium]
MASKKRAVLMICDGHRDDFVSPEFCPEICKVVTGGRRFANHSAIFPSATRASAASIATGCWPATHGLHGNSMAFDEGAGPVVHDVGKPEFLDIMRRATGRTLDVPTMAERLTDHGGAIIMSNVSPGAAYFNDPDGHGHVYHRAGSYGPGRVEISPETAPPVSGDAAGDIALTDRFCDQVLMQQRAALSVLWLCEPDTSMHADVLGSDRHLQGIKSADACVAKVAAAVESLRGEGEDVLFVLGSDHGQETVADAVPVAALMVAAGLKASLDSTDVAIAPQGAGAHLYLSDAAWDRLPAIRNWLTIQPWCGPVFVGAELRAIGHRPGGVHALSFAMRHQDKPNANGALGLIDICTSEEKPGKPPGHGSHGGLGAYETRPFLTISGGGFAQGTVEHGQSRLIDIAPTILRHLDMPRDGIDGLALPQF